MKNIYVCLYVCVYKQILRIVHVTLFIYFVWHKTVCASRDVVDDDDDVYSPQPETVHKTSSAITRFCFGKVIGFAFTLSNIILVSGINSAKSYFNLIESNFGWFTISLILYLWPPLSLCVEPTFTVRFVLNWYVQWAFL